MPTEIEENSLELSVLATAIKHFNIDTSTCRYQMEELIIMSNTLLKQGGNIPDDVTSLLIDCLYNYLIDIEEAENEDNPSLLANALYLNGVNTKRNEIKSREFTIAFRKGFIEGKKKEKPISCSAEDVAGRICEYLKAELEPEYFFQTEGRYLAETGRKEIRAVDLGKLFSVYFNVKPKTANAYFKNFHLYKLTALYTQT